jgi:hypothetical protein
MNSFESGLKENAKVCKNAKIAGSRPGPHGSRWESARAARERPNIDKTRTGSEQIDLSRQFSWFALIFAFPADNSRGFGMIQLTKWIPAENSWSLGKICSD